MGLLGPFMSFQDLLGPSRSFLVLSCPFMSFLALSGPSWCFMILSGPFRSFLDLSDPFWTFQILSGSFRSFLVLSCSQAKTASQNWRWGNCGMGSRQTEQQTGPLPPSQAYCTNWEILLRKGCIPECQQWTRDRNLFLFQTFLCQCCGGIDQC